MLKLALALALTSLVLVSGHPIVQAVSPVDQEPNTGIDQETTDVIGYVHAQAEETPDQKAESQTGELPEGTYVNTSRV